MESRLQSKLASLEELARLKDEQILALQDKLELQSKESRRKDAQISSLQEELKTKSQLATSMPSFVNSEKLKVQVEAANLQLQTANAERNRLETLLREKEAELQKLRRRVREVELVERNREQRFKEALQNLEPVVVEVPPDENLVAQIYKIMSGLREGLVKVAFEVFLNNASSAFERKVNSLTLFLANVESLRANRTLAEALGTYVELRRIIRQSFPGYGRSADGDPAYLSLIWGRAPEPKELFRDEFNLWLESTMQEVLEKAKKQKKASGHKGEPLYRLLALYYRVRFPVHEGVYRLDLDLLIRLEDKTLQYLLAFLTT